MKEEKGKEEPKIKITKNGPYLVSGKIPLDKEIIIVDKSHCPVKWQKKEDYPEQPSYALCRCGHSCKKPFCDGEHLKSKFDGTETASREPYIEQAETIVGEDLILTDAQDLCAAGRFCHRSLGTWKLTEQSGNPENKKIAIETCHDCPSGRLVAWDKKGKPIEKEFKPTISVTEDPDKKASGPLWVKGNIQVESSDGFNYEKRNRVTLCRCGKSLNKPFCDGSHLDIKFNDGDDSLKK